MNGGGFAGEEEEAIVIDMEGEIDEHVDAVGLDEVGGFVVIQGVDVAPVWGGSLEFIGMLVGSLDGAVTEVLDAIAIEGLEDGQEATADDVDAEIGRDPADAELSGRGWGSWV